MNFQILVTALFAAIAGGNRTSLNSETCASSSPSSFRSLACTSTSTSSTFAVATIPALCTFDTSTLVPSRPQPIEPSPALPSDASVPFQGLYANPLWSLKAGRRQARMPHADVEETFDRQAALKGVPEAVIGDAQSTVYNRVVYSQKSSSNAQSSVYNDEYKSRANSCSESTHLLHNKFSSATHPHPAPNNVSSDKLSTGVNASKYTNEHSLTGVNGVGTAAGTHSYITDADALPDKRVHAAKAAHAHRGKVIWVVAGPAGCGKSSVGKFVAKELDVPFLEADDYHSEANKQKMANGTPLTDNDRRPWLESLKGAARQKISTENADGVVLTCSALKKSYRDKLREVRAKDVDVVFLFLDSDESEIERRVAARKDHFMKADMVRSQFEVMEKPDLGAEKDSVVVDTRSLGLTQVEQVTLAKVHEKLAEMTG